MSGEERFLRWARLARRDEPAALDVAPAVMARLAHAVRPAAAPVDRTLLGFALGSAAAAAVVLVLVLLLDPSLGDPLAEFLQAVSGGTG